MNDPEEDPRASAPGVCGLTYSTGKIEWVCVREVHDGGGRNKGWLDGRGNVAQRHRHHFVNRWPNRATTPTP